MRCSYPLDETKAKLSAIIVRRLDRLAERGILVRPSPAADPVLREVARRRGALLRFLADRNK